jgi:hypothetical protein
MNWNIIIFAITIHIISTYYVYHIGEYHYHPSKSIKRNLDKVWDVCHKYLPDIYHGQVYINLLFLIPIFISLYSNTFTNLVNDVITYFPIIVIIRSIIIFVTILPRHKKCTDKLTWKSFINGHCYDKIFSGHYSLFLLTTLILHRYNAINLTQLSIINIITALTIIITRSHYTTDIIIAFFITFSVYNNCYNL